MCVGEGGEGPGTGGDCTVPICCDVCVGEGGEEPGAGGDHGWTALSLGPDGWQPQGAPQKRGDLPTQQVPVGFSMLI